MDRSRAVDLFIAAVKGGSLSSAARQFGLTPASVSRQISGLEASLAARLLNRSSRALALTEAGQIYYDAVCAVARQMEAVHERLHEVSRTARGKIRLHAHTFIGMGLILPLIESFLRQHPDIDIAVSLSNTNESLADGSFDISVRFGRPADSALMLRRLGSTMRVLVATPGYLASSAALHHPADLERHSCLTFSADPGASTWSFKHGDTTIAVNVGGRFSTDFGPALHNLALAGFGIALLPEWSVRDQLAGGSLVRLLPAYAVTHEGFEDSGIYAVYHRDRYMTEKISLLLEFLSHSLEATLSSEAKALKTASS